jgi:hypothetical protein
MPSRRTSATTGRFARFWPRLGVDAEAALAAANAPETTAEQSGVLYTTVDTEQDLVDALEKTLDCPMISQRDLAPPRGLAQR